MARFGQTSCGSPMHPDAHCAFLLAGKIWSPAPARQHPPRWLSRSLLELPTNTSVTFAGAQTVFVTRAYTEHSSMCGVREQAESAAVPVRQPHVLQSAETSHASVIVPVARDQLVLSLLLHALLQVASLQERHAAVRVHDKGNGCYYMAVLPGRITPTPTLKYKDALN
jgi:hypothetical protein